MKIVCCVFYVFSCCVFSEQLYVCHESTTIYSLESRPFALTTVSKLTQPSGRMNVSFRLSSSWWGVVDGSWTQLGGR